MVNDWECCAYCVYTKMCIYGADAKVGEHSREFRSGGTPEGCGLSAGFALRLLTGVAFEIDHLAFHFLASGVGGGTHALNAEFKFVGVGCAQQSFVKGDEVLGVKIK